MSQKKFLGQNVYSGTPVIAVHVYLLLHGRLLNGLLVTYSVQSKHRIAMIGVLYFYEYQT